MTDINNKDDELLEGELPPALKAAIEKKKAKGMKNDDSEESDDGEEEKMVKEKKQAKVKEDIDAIFSGESLSEEFKNNAKAIFEAAIFAKVEEAKTALEEEYAEQLETEVASINENLVTKVDEYLEYVVSEWMEENKLAVETGIKAELAEDFMIGLKNLFTEHYVDIPEDKINVVEEFAEKVETLESELDKVVTENANLNAQIGIYKKDQIVSEVSEGLSEVQFAKLKSLAEGIEFVSEQDYKEKLLLTKKKYFDEKTEETVKKVAPMDDDISSLEESFSPVMSHYVQNISRTLKK
jgi:SHS2 domain-containing protein